MKKKISPIWQLSKQEVVEVIASVNTKSDALKKIGMENKGSNFKTLNKVLEYHDISTNHFVSGSGKILENIRNKIPINNLLVENSNHSRSNLKKRLLKEGLMNNECCICGLTNEWNSKPIKMILDHKNGVSNDNRIDNLRMICPNCNSQLDTHCGKHKKSIQYFCECGAEITKNSKKCLKCSGVDKRIAKDRPNKEDLTSLIDQLGYSGTGRLYGVSGNAVKKWLLNFGG